MDAADPHAIGTRAPVEALIEGLSRRGALVAGERAQVVQTHISVVFLAGRRAWKLKKPLRLWGLVDYGTFEARRHWCHEEVRLNRRLAPGIYLGVVPVTRAGDGFTVGGDGEVVEHAVEMVRLPAGATLLERLQAGEVAAGDVAAVGRRLASFHAAHRLQGEAARNGLPSRFARTLRQNFAGSSRGVPDPFPAGVHEGLRVRVVRRLAAERGRLRARVRGGRMVDGHGDIRLEHVIWHDGDLAVIDCCEFSERLRHVDPLADAAFLSMDLAVHGRPDLAEAFERAYLAASGEADGAHLLPLYRAYRAQVRAMVDEQSCREPEIAADVRRRKALGARRCLAYAWANACVGAVPPVVVMRGASGTGKSVLAGSLAPWLRAEVIRSDVLRKELLGMEPTARPDAEARGVVYGAAMHVRTYAAMLERAERTLARGRAAILDATYLRRDARAAARAFAAAQGAPVAYLDVTCPPDVIRERLRRRAERGDDASDADWAIYLEQMREDEPLDSEEEALCVRFASGRPPEEAVLPLVAILERQTRPREASLGPEPPGTVDP